MCRKSGQAAVVPTSSLCICCPDKSDEGAGDLQRSESLSTEISPKRPTSYYKNYRQRRKQKALGMALQIDEMKLAALELKAEQRHLINDLVALESYYSYSDAMFAVAGFAAEHSQTLGVPASLRICAAQQWVIPSVSEEGTSALCGVNRNLG
jgi:hypothetical protein